MIIYGRLFWEHVNKTNKIKIREILSSIKLFTFYAYKTNPYNKVTGYLSIYVSVRKDLASRRTNLVLLTVKLLIGPRKVYLWVGYYYLRPEKIAPRKKHFN